MSKIRVVIDTNVLVSALLSPSGNPAKIYKMFLTGMLSLIFSTDIFEEYQDVLRRPSLKISPIDSDIIFSSILQYGEKVEPVPSIIVLPDEDDRVFYDTAKTAGAYLVTGNKKHYPQEPFMLTPTEFLEL